MSPAPVSFPRLDPARIRALVFEELEAIFESREQDVDVAALGEDPRLFGENGVLDSLGLVVLVAELEARLEDEFGVAVVLTSARAMSSVHSPFESVGLLVEFILHQAKGGEETESAHG